MFNIIPPLLIVIGLGGLIILLETNKKNKEKNPNLEIADLNNLQVAQKIALLKDKIKQFNQNFVKVFLQVSEKLLIRLRIVILRIDRGLYATLSSLRKHKNKPEEEKTKLFDLIESKKKTRKTTKSLKININKEKRILNEINKLEKKVLTNENDVDSLLNLARLHLYLEDYSSVRYYLIKAFKIDNKNTIIHDLIVSVFEKEKKIEKENSQENEDEEKNEK